MTQQRFLRWPDKLSAQGVALANAWRSTLAFLVVFLLHPSGAWAQEISFGMMFCNAFENMGSLPGLIYGISFIGGIILIGMGVVGLRESAEAGAQKPIYKPILMLIIGGFLMAFPAMTSFVTETLFRGDAGGGGWYCSPGGSGSAGGADLSDMIINFVDDVKQPIISGVVAVAFVLGVFYIGRGLFKAAKYGQDPRTHSMPIIVGHMAFGALLLVLSQSLGSMLTTIFGTSEIASFSGISWSGGGSGGGDMTKANDAIKAAIIFFQLVGLIAFLRGWVIVKQSVEGTSQATVGQGLTHVIGGAIAVNMPMFLMAAERTFGIDIIS